MTKEDRAAYDKARYSANRKTILEKKKALKNTQIGRAQYLVDNYNREDKKYGRGRGNLTAKWIVENIFSKPCAHCGKTGWDVIGCNRIDNSNPHTMDNVEPCCWDCNNKLAAVSNSERKSKTVYQYDKNTLELIRVWESTISIERELGYDQGNISKCCNGKYKQAYGYIWSYTPL